jgi:urease accessory protein
MFVNVSPYEVHLVYPAPVPSCVRANSTVRASFARHAESTAVAGLYEAGAVRLRFPKAGPGCEGVLINTSGGMAGGDTTRLSFDLQRRAAVTLTTQSAEKVYRAEAAPASSGLRLTLADEACLAWLPQETILFDGAKLARSIEITMAARARLTLLEIVVFGRMAAGERLNCGFFRDRWRVRRAGELVLAEDVRLEGEITELLARAATGGGARAVATLVHVSPNAEARLKPVRRALAGARSESAASAWNGLLVARFASVEPAVVRADAMRAVIRLLRAPLPRVWLC